MPIVWPCQEVLCECFFLTFCCKHFVTSWLLDLVRCHNLHTTTYTGHWWHQLTMAIWMCYLATQCQSLLDTEITSGHWPHKSRLATRPPTSLTAWPNKSCLATRPPTSLATQSPHKAHLATWPQKSATGWHLSCRVHVEPAAPRRHLLLTSAWEGFIAVFFLVVCKVSRNIVLLSEKSTILW